MLKNLKQDLGKQNNNVYTVRESSNDENIICYSLRARGARMTRTYTTKSCDLTELDDESTQCCLISKDIGVHNF